MKKGGIVGLFFDGIDAYIKILLVLGALLLLQYGTWKAILICFGLPAFIWWLRKD